MGKKAVALLLAIGSILFSGCLDARSPDEYGYAMMIGIDKGQEKEFYISMLLQRGNGNTESAPEEACTMAGVECDNLFEAVDLLGGSMPFAVNLTRTTAIVFSEEVAAGGKLEDLLTSSLGVLLIRYYANLIVSLGRADAFLEGVQDSLAPNVAKLQFSFVEYGEDTGYVPSITLTQFYDRAWSDTGDVILPLGANEGKGEEQEEEPPKELANARDLLGEETYMPGSMVRRGGLASGMMGSAVFKDTRLIGFLNGQHTQMLLMATGQFFHGRMSVPIGGKDVGISISHRESPVVSLDLSDPPRTHCIISLYAAIDQPSEIAGVSNERIKEDIETYLEGKISAVFQACQMEGADVFELGKAAVVQFSNTYEWESFDWEAVYQSVLASFQVEVEMHHDPAVSRLE